MNCCVIGRKSSQGALQCVKGIKNIRDVLLAVILFLAKILKVEKLLGAAVTASGHGEAA